jgi:DnaJ family protein C protein 28
LSKIEEHIRKAMRGGKFDNLPGKGKPLRLDDHPHSSPQWRLAHHLLKENGFTLPWIERLRNIELQREVARANLLRVWRWRQEALDSQSLPAAQLEVEWRRATTVFKQQIEDLNRQILAYNLEVPLTRFQKQPLNADHEIARLTGLEPSDTL